MYFYKTKELQALARLLGCPDDANFIRKVMAKQGHLAARKRVAGRQVRGYYVKG